MGNELESVAVICPAYQGPGAARNEDGAAKRYRVEAFDAPVMFTDSYETTVTCPNCGAELKLSVKTKGKLTKVQKEQLLREKCSDLKHSLLLLFIATALLAAGVSANIFIAGNTLKTISICLVVVLFPLWLFLLITIFRSVKNLKHYELIFKKYEEKNPYVVSLGESSTHYFRGQKKTIVWQQPPVKSRKPEPLSDFR